MYEILDVLLLIDTVSHIAYFKRKICKYCTLWKGTLWILQFGTLTFRYVFIDFFPIHKTAIDTDPVGTPRVCMCLFTVHDIVVGSVES